MTWITTTADGITHIPDWMLYAFMVTATLGALALFCAAHGGGRR